MKNIILCGFMGCGKTTVGKEISRITNMPFIDTDSYIEDKLGMTVSDIFAKYGEGHFRLLELECAAELSERGGCVIATGGGMVLEDINAELLRRNGTIVFLDTPLDVILKRLQNDTTRPLLQHPNRDEYIPKIHAMRYPKYKSAARLIFDTSDKTAITSAKEILEQIEL